MIIVNLDNKHQTDPDIMGDDFFNQGDKNNLDDEINNINNQEEEVSYTVVRLRRISIVEVK